MGIEIIKESKLTYTDLPDGSTAHCREPAIGKCHCGREVILSGFTCACDCGADYNSAGQQLAPRSQWGEETGESVADILAVDTPYEGSKLAVDPGEDCTGCPRWESQGQFCGGCYA